MAVQFRAIIKSYTSQNYYWVPDFVPFSHKPVLLAYFTAPTDFTFHLQMDAVNTSV